MTIADSVFDASSGENPHSSSSREAGDALLCLAGGVNFGWMSALYEGSARNSTRRNTSLVTLEGLFSSKTPGLNGSTTVEGFQRRVPSDWQCWKS